MTRVSEIPAKIKLRNLDPNGLAMNIAGLVGIPADGKVHERILSNFRPEMRQRVWDALLTMQGSRLIEFCNDAEPVTAEAQKPPPAKEVNDDFTKAGLSELIQMRLYARGIRTYDSFLNTSEKDLLMIEGISQSNFMDIVEKVSDLNDAKKAPHVGNPV